ncbi:APC family permease [Solibacillus sp. MA9]|uniref:APC family permease n=1 Tax=Solibacillus palustris TaxID=2908203 RepID=A0ABS9U7W0_9BACL|nr:APC family permease [Solibacillus sp. MA9]MCH7320421.1 APC family permease [Solibacillus sp. MA9]
MWKQIFIGKPLKLNSEKQQAVSKKEALALLSSDALSSVAYGPEQIMIVLWAATALNSLYTLPVAGLILALLFLLVIAYRSVITQFPEGGGAYKVTQKYMNNYVALCTAGLLLVDYILTIAVSVSAGVDALTSAFPSLHASRILISVLFIGGILLLNLRGVTETARVLMFPVYGFIVAMLLVFIMALFKWNDAVIVSPTTVEAFSWMLLIKAFAVGCSALTGVEAISNAVPNFKKPTAVNAQKTMLVLAGILTLLFSGVLIFATHFQITPSMNETVLSQLASQIVGRNGFYFFIQAVTISILLLAANTSFAAFPQLLANLAKDGYAPRIFLNRGDRLRLL